VTEIDLDKLEAGLKRGSVMASASELNEIWSAGIEYLKMMRVTDADKQAALNLFRNRFSATIRGLMKVYHFEPWEVEKIEAALMQPSRWQPIETAPKGDDVLTWDGFFVRLACHMDGDRWQEDGSPSHRPTHWMPLPSAPEGEGK
jgi:hypothetical protein